MRRSTRFLALIAASAALVGILGCNLPDAQLVTTAGAPAAQGEQGVLRPSTWGSKAVARAISVQNLHTSKLLSIKGVIGAGASVAADESPVVVVFAERAGVPGIPAELDGVPVVVEVTGKVEALQAKGKTPTTTSTPTPACVAPDRAGRFARPVPIGVSTGHISVTAGTIGVRVKDKKGNLFLLSNNHVFANVNKAKAGENILQPGAFDGGKNPADAIGTLSTWQTLTFCTGSACPANAMDAALAATTAAQAGKATPCDGYGTPSATVYPVIIPNLAVKKYGRTTGLTRGVIAAVNVTVDVGYTATSVARFTGQVYIAAPNFNGPGDSGSLIVSDAGNQPVALLFAGTSTATFATPISPILTKFGVTIDGI